MEYPAINPKISILLKIILFFEENRNIRKIK